MRNNVILHLFRFYPNNKYLLFFFLLPPHQSTLILAESKKETHDRMYSSFICPYKGCCFNYADMERKLSAIKMLTAMWIIQV